MHTQPLASRNADQNGCSDPKAPARSELRLTQETLETLMEETATRAATAAVNHFVASRRYRTTSSSDSVHPDTGRGKKCRINDTSISNHDIPKRSTPHNEDEGDSSLRRASPRKAVSKSRIPDKDSRTINETRSSWGALPARQSPFTNDILSETLPQGVKLTNLPDFDGTSDPQEHIDKFYAKADLYSTPGNLPAPLTLLCDAGNISLAPSVGIVTSSLRMHTQPLASRNADQNGCSDPKAPARSELRLTQEALETLMEETATRAATAAVNHFVASRQYRTTSSSDSFTRDTGLPLRQNLNVNLRDNPPHIMTPLAMRSSPDLHVNDPSCRERQPECKRPKKPSRNKIASDSVRDRNEKCNNLRDNPPHIM
ncbi:hypothetical protein F511_22448 [Dorcoceras hygrometricum]|uniref:Uncharacterized protein n=1 Tax=Dorcoceras hygrometricum TaxID=472368 RepID=A0A2Z7APK4_9LAMI|nr:hypothetical protein F511_22448 [Dorcoceras hygrometricum]